MVTPLSPTELAQLLSSSRGVDMVDVRDQNEWDSGHIDGSRLVPLEQLRADPDRELVRAPAIVFVCAKGIRSLAAAKLAERFGYEHVYTLDGGVKAWASAGFAVDQVDHARAAA